MYQHEVNSEMPECVFRNSSLSDPSKLEEEKSVAMNKQMDVQYDVYESVFARRICKLATEELPRMSPLKTFGSFLKTSFVGMDEEEADQLLRVDEEIIEYSNEDIISVKPGSVVRKCWRVKNIGTRQWPQDTRLVSVTDNLFFIGPQIHQFLKPGEMMDLGINIYINPQEDGDNNIQEYIVRLYSKQYK